MTAPSDVVMWSGAGMSLEAPTCLPTGPTLTARVFESFFEAATLKIVLDYHRTLGWWSPTFCDLDDTGNAEREVRLPRLETVLGVAARTNAEQALEILADVRDASPNWQHQVFAEHLWHGGHHITTNFDSCIEKAFGERLPGRDLAGRIEHIHGSFAEDPSGASLGATLARIQRGLAAEQTEALTAFLRAGKLLMIAGYSGSDFFDVDVAVANLPAGALGGLKVLWIWHSQHGWHRLPPRDGGEPPLADYLRRAGASVELVCGPTGEFFMELANQWRLDTAARTRLVATRQPIVRVSEQLQRAATFALYGELGLHTEVARMLDAGPPPAVGQMELWQARSELLWEQGKWGTLRRLWRHRAPGGIDPAARAERIGACWWVQGRLLPAYLWLTWHRRRCPDVDSRLMLAETEGRVVEHMARTPELRPIARRLAPGVVHALGETHQTAGVHLYRRRSDLASSLESICTGRPRDAGHAVTSSLWFTEAGNLRASLSYRHRHYRDSYDRSIPDRKLAQRYRTMADQYRAVGSDAGALRTHQLPGAERVFGLGEFLHAIVKLQFGWWHRVRLLVRYLPLRLRYLGSRHRIPS